MQKLEWTFIVDTDSYAGNFERELNAYMTGMWDGETHGEDQAEDFDKCYDGFIGESPFSNDMVERTCDTCPEWPQYQGLEYSFDSKQQYNSVGIFFRNEPTAKQIVLMKHRAYRFAKEGKVHGRPVHIKILRFRIRRTSIITESMVKIV